MNNNKDQNNACYQLDYFEFDGKNYPSLTKKNRDFIEAILSIDSNYRQYTNNTINHHIYKNIEDPLSKIFKRLNDENEDFKTNLLKIIVLIDTSNSTHLSASFYTGDDNSEFLTINNKEYNVLNGLKEMRDRIAKSIHNVNELIGAIKTPFDPYDKNHIFNIMNEPTIKREKNKKYNEVNETYIQKNKKFNTSFVSKFLSYCYSYLIGSDNMYSKYDNVLAKYLPIYYANYYYKNSEIKIDENRYIISESKRAQLKKQGIERLKIEYAKLYEKYNNDIQDIIDELKKANINLTRDEVDHIIWYTLKGN